MRIHYKVGPVYKAGLIVTGGMCAGLGMAILAALKLHHVSYARLVSASVPMPPTSALAFFACGVALIGIGYCFPRVTSLLAMVTMSLIVTMAGEKALGIGPRVESLIATNLGGGSFIVAPNTAIALLLAALALLIRHTPRWYENRLALIGILGSLIFAIGIAGAVGYMTGIPTYAWQTGAPMSFLCTVCACVLGLGIVMSACRYSELDEFGTPRWFSLVLCTGALTINIAVAVSYLCRADQDWARANLTALMPMMVVSGLLSLVAARQARRECKHESAVNIL